MYIFLDPHFGSYLQNNKVFQSKIKMKLTGLQGSNICNLLPWILHITKMLKSIYFVNFYFYVAIEIFLFEIFTVFPVVNLI